MSVESPMDDESEADDDSDTGPPGTMTMGSHGLWVYSSIEEKRENEDMYEVQCVDMASVTLKCPEDHEDVIYPTEEFREHFMNTPGHTWDEYVHYFKEWDYFVPIDAADNSTIPDFFKQ